ncbi:MAG: diguanylate cyclase, partial [Ectothiorhodospiraceae bacterium]|nr:diguanylate cyclase [Ectothiorhodospiraceae bacterium]
DPQFIVQRLMGPFGRGRREETAILRQNGERVPVQLSISRIENQSGNEVRHAAIFNDLSAIKRSQASLAESEARLRAILEHVTEGIVVTDARGRILSANPAVERLLGRSASSIHERPLHEWITDVQGEDPWPQIEQTLSGGESWKGEVRWLRPGAEDLPLALGVQAIRGTDGRVLNHVAILSDISAHKAEQARLTRLALHDPLTGLPNRRLFEDRLMHALEGARRHRGRVGIVMVDLDDFKPINDRLGHDQGDIALRFIARRLRHQFRRVDTVARVGGDEFVVVLTDLAAPEDAVLVATKVLRAMQRPMRLKGERCSIGASIGISLYPHTAQDVMELIRQADQAMYLAKKEGGNRIRFWTRDMVDERKR